MKQIFLLHLCLFLMGCAKGQGISLMPYHDPNASPQDFNLCHGFGCSFKTPVGLSQKQWRYATAPLRKKAKTPAQERKNLTKAIARIEKAVQKSSGLRPDLGQAQTFEKDQHQMDCLDETINTSLYLDFITQEDLLKFHDIYEPVHRGYFINGMWPHNSAAIQDSKTGEIFAIDSYFTDTGEEVYAVSLDTWLKHWRPEHLRKVPKPKRKPKR